MRKDVNFTAKNIGHIEWVMLSTVSENDYISEIYNSIFVSLLFKTLSRAGFLFVGQAVWTKLEHRLFIVLEITYWYIRWLILATVSKSTSGKNFDFMLLKSKQNQIKEVWALRLRPKGRRHRGGLQRFSKKSFHLLMQNQKYKNCQLYHRIWNNSCV